LLAPPPASDVAAGAALVNGVSPPAAALLFVPNGLALAGAPAEAGVPPVLDANGLGLAADAPAPLAAGVLAAAAPPASPAGFAVLKSDGAPLPLGVLNTPPLPTPEG
jgi:hypothetical protein